MSHRQRWANLFLLNSECDFTKMMLPTDMALWTIACSVEVIKSTFES